MISVIVSKKKDHQDDAVATIMPRKSSMLH